MPKPFDGWKILTKLLKPKGLMNIGLYSKLGRKASIEARAIIQKHGLDFKRGNLLKFRKQIIDGKFPQLDHLQHSRSFFDESSLRDAFFHVKEHHFTIPQIDEILSKLENKDTNLNESESDYLRLMQLNKHIDELLKKRLKEISKNHNHD